MSSGNASSLSIDVAAVATRDALHQLLAEAFGFPAYYGRNWDAFDECVRDSARSGHVTISGFESLRAKLPREAALFEQCMLSFAAEDPRRCVIFSAT